MIPGGTANTKNLMSYDDASCQDMFTPDQQARARCYMESDYAEKHNPGIGPGIVVLDVTVAAGAGAGAGATLAWLPPVGEAWCTTEGGCIQAYKVERAAVTDFTAPVGAGAWKELTTLVAGVVVGATTTRPARQFTDTGGGRGHAYRVSAVDKSGWTGPVGPGTCVDGAGTIAYCKAGGGAPPTKTSDPTTTPVSPKPTSPSPSPPVSDGGGKPSPAWCTKRASVGAELLPGSYDGINCVCTGQMVCVGSGCVRGSAVIGMSWYSATCAGCTCQGREDSGTGGGSNNQNGDGGQAGTDSAVEGSLFDPRTPMGLGLIIGIGAVGLILVTVIIVVACRVRRRDKEGANKPHVMGDEQDGGLELGYNDNPMSGTLSGDGDGRRSLAPTHARPVSTIRHPGLVQLPGGWKEELDAESGSYYFYNFQSGETRWDPPSM